MQCDHLDCAIRVYSDYRSPDGKFLDIKARCGCCDKRLLDIPNMPLFLLTTPIPNFCSLRVASVVLDKSERTLRRHIKAGLLEWLVHERRLLVRYRKEDQ